MMTERPRHRRWVVALATGALLATSFGAIAQPVFDDVDEGSAHAGAINSLVSRGIMQGRSDTAFAPGDTMTRAQLASVVARAADLTPSENRPFSDVSDGPHADNIAAAHEAGLVQGFPDGTFRPNLTITRDQIAAVLYRWLEPEDVEEDAFTDLSSTQHRVAINSLAAIGVAQGTEARTFLPRNNLRRDQAASFVWRAVQHIEFGDVHPWNEVAEHVLNTELPAGDIAGVEFHGTIEVAGTTSVNPVRYELGETLVTAGRFGMRIYDIRNRYQPRLIGVLPRAELALEGDNPNNNYHTTESMNVDKERKIAVLSRDPRAFGRNQASGPAGFYLIDIADPTNPQVIGFHEAGAGHTSTCINNCQYVWSGGPSRATDNPADWIARPIKVTDISDPHNPIDMGWVDLGRWRGITDYAHDVQVDQAGVAWVSGRGGIRGYWTEGVHFDPVQNRYRIATASDPVPYAGGEVGEYTSGELGEPARLNGAIHNMERPIDGAQGEQAWTDSERPRRPGANDGANLATSGYAPGELVYVTDENFTTPCGASGKFYIASLAGANEGQAWRTAAEVEELGAFELDEVGVWSVFDKEGTSTGGCSAHYFNMQDGIVAGGWYGQGFRFLDVADPTDPIQIAYFRPNGGSGWSVHWIGDVIYANDSNRGLHILTLDTEAAVAAASRTELLAPQMSPAAEAAALAVQAEMIADPVFGWSCALPAPTEL